MLLSAGAGDKSLNMARMCTTVGRSKFLNYGFEPLAFHGGGSSNFFFLFLGSKTVSIFHNLSCLQKNHDFNKYHLIFKFDNHWKYPNTYINSTNFQSTNSKNWGLCSLFVKGFIFSLNHIRKWLVLSFDLIFKYPL